MIEKTTCLLPVGDSPSINKGMNKRRSKWYDPQTVDEAGKPRCCDWPGCEAAAGYRAPRSRDELNNYYWFCLEHVRNYNKSWNFYEGMGDVEVEAEVRSDTTWNRPTWPLGARPGGPRLGDKEFRDDFGFFEAATTAKEKRRRVMSPWEKGLNTMGLKPPVTTQQIKARYKELVKRYHPDANGGDKGAEEKFKQISQAYRTVIDSLSS